MPLVGSLSSAPFRDRPSDRSTATARRAGAVSLLAVAVWMAAAALASAQARVERNVIYGSYSGLTLLLDVHHPEKPNGRGVIFIAGTAWHGPLTYSTQQLKESQVGDWAPSLLEAGYTVFALNHRLAPRFRYPEPVEDVQRAVRFVRHTAQRFGIDADRIGGLGGSSGGHLIGLVGLLAAPGIADANDPIDKQPATLQCIVLRAAPAEMPKMIGKNPVATAAVSSFLNRLPTPMAGDQRVYKEASPITYVKASSPPTLLVHGDADDTVPYEQSVAMEAALRGAGVATKIVRVPDGAHGSDFGRSGKPHPMMPDVLRETVAWLDAHLRQASR